MGVAGSIGFTMSPQPEERQHGQDHDNQSHQINNTAHFSLLALVIDRTAQFTARFPTRSFPPHRPPGRPCLKGRSSPLWRHRS